ncbi:MAG: hypothetical protein ACOYOS_24575 [Syntrophales bacterium]
MPNENDVLFHPEAGKFGDIVLNDELTCWKSVLSPPITREQITPLIGAATTFLKMVNAHLPEKQAQPYHPLLSLHPDIGGKWKIQLPRAKDA